MWIIKVKFIYFDKIFIMYKFTNLFSLRTIYPLVIFRELDLLRW